MQVYSLYDEATQGWPSEQCGLVIAAPITAQAVCTWIKRQRVCFTQILDLRGEAINEPLPKALLAETEIMDLKEFF